MTYSGVVDPEISKKGVPEKHGAQQSLQVMTKIVQCNK